MSGSPQASYQRLEGRLREASHVANAHLEESAYDRALAAMEEVRSELAGTRWEAMLDAEAERVVGLAEARKVALEKAETYLWLFPAGPLPVHLEPRELWLRETTGITFDAWENAVGAISDVYGQVAMWGSRYPRHDASAPDEALAMLQRNEVGAGVLAQLMAGNAARLFGL